MNFKFEKDLLHPVFQGKDLNIIYEDRLQSLAGTKIAVDASILLEMAKDQANPQKYIQEGGASLDMQLQNRLKEIITTLKNRWKI